ncbi:MAG: glycosyltransferase family 2 protein [Oscillospiraceae bacterium]|nr:glycosyltransferase family 2 protein [Oscillospiraceae bacterium]
MKVLSVIIPAYNEETNIKNTADTVCSLLKNADIDCELIFVDDGSKDKTYLKICDSAQENPNVRGISFSRNFGKEAAIFAGLEEAAGDCAVILDCDLQFPPEKIIEMYSLWQKGYEVVEGVKRDRGNESFFYKIFAKSFYKIISRFVGVDMQSTSDFKLIDRKAIDALLSLPERNTFFRALSFWSGFNSVQVEFSVSERKNGKSKWTIGKLIKYAVSSITSFTTAPLQLITVIGSILLVFMAVLGVQTLVRFMLGHSAEGFTTVILLLLLVGGSLMMALGIIGYYIARIYEEVKGRPRYIISKRTENKK